MPRLISIFTSLISGANSMDHPVKELILRTSVVKYYKKRHSLPRQRSFKFEISHKKLFSCESWWTSHIACLYHFKCHSFEQFMHACRISLNKDYFIFFICHLFNKPNAELSPITFHNKNNNHRKSGLCMSLTCTHLIMRSTCYRPLWLNSEIVGCPLWVTTACST